MGLEDRDYMREPGWGTRRGTPSIKDRSPSWEYSTSANAGSSARRSGSVSTSEGVVRERVLVGLAWCCAAQALCVAVVAASGLHEIVAWFADIAMPVSKWMLVPIGALTIFAALLVPSSDGKHAARALFIAAIPAIVAITVGALLRATEPVFLEWIFLLAFLDVLSGDWLVSNFYFCAAVVGYWLAAPSFVLAACFTHHRSALSWELSLADGGERHYPLKLGAIQLTPILMLGLIAVLVLLKMGRLAEFFIDLFQTSWVLFLVRAALVAVSLYVAALALGQVDRAAKVR